MAPLKVGDKFPSGIDFDYVPIGTSAEDLNILKCGSPDPNGFKTDDRWKGKKVVIVAVPGAFTPSCSAYHLPPYINGIEKLKAKGVDQVAIIAFNDGWVMSSWAKANKYKGGEDIVFLSDKGFSKEHGWSLGDTGRTGRYAMIVEKDGTISYAENESNPVEVTVSGIDAVLAKL